MGHKQSRSKESTQTNSLAHNTLDKGKNIRGDERDSGGPKVTQPLNKVTDSKQAKIQDIEMKSSSWGQGDDQMEMHAQEFPPVWGNSNLWFSI